MSNFADIITFTRASAAWRFNSSGVLEQVAADEPRFDYDPVTLALRGLLVEEQRTNLLTYSSQFDNAAWVRDQIQTVTADARQAPDGTTSADKIVEGTTSGTHGIYRASVGAAGAHAFYVFMHAAERSWGVVRIEGVSTFFNLASGMVGQNGAGNTASIKPVGDGWYCCCVVRTLTAAAAATIRIATADGLENYTGDGLSGIYVWGAQVEAGAFPTSYIPTTSSQVTRAADVASVNTLSPWFNPDEGTFFVEATAFATSGFPGLYGTDDLSAYWSRPAANSQLTGRGSTGWLAINVPASSILKRADAYNATSAASSANGSAVIAEARARTASVSQLRLGVVGSGRLNGHLRRIMYYPSRLNDEELQKLTT